MAREYDVKEAKRLIDAHKKLRERASTLDGVFNARERELIIAKTTKFSDNVCAGLIRKEIIDPTADANTVELENYIKITIYLGLIKDKHDLLVRQINYYDNYIKKDIDLLSYMSGMLQWFFASKEQKVAANEAYKELEESLNGDYKKRIDSCENDFALINEQMDQFDFWDEYTNNAFHLRKLIQEHIDFLRLTDGTIAPDILIIINKWKRIIDAVKRIPDLNDKYQQAVEKDVTKIKEARTLKIMEEIPVEEINRKRGGFRTKALRDAGYETVRDLNAATVHEISSCQGISDNAARQIKRSATEMFKDAFETVKFTLSTDEKDRYSTELIETIFKYKYFFKPLEKELSDFANIENSVIKYARDLGEAKGGIKWLFKTDSQKKEIKDAYDNLKSLSAERYEKSLHNYTVVSGKPSTYETRNRAWEDFSKNPVSYFNILEEFVPGALGNTDSYYGLPEDLAREIQDEVFFPDGLLCTLRNYQEWGVKYALHQGNVLLGDEMGLGKTIQAIATMVSLRNIGETHFMVVCPASVIINWCREIRKMSKLSVTKIHGLDRKQAFKSWFINGGVAVTTYETTSNIEFNPSHKFGLLVVDEAHYIKNPDAIRSKNVRRLCEHARRHLFLTGTALENKVDEMISLVDILNPSIAKQLQSIAFMSTAPQFRETVAPVYYRRKREDVLTELPEMTEIEEWCSLNRSEQGIYEQSVLNKKYADVRRVSWNVDNIKQSSKAARLMEIVADAADDDRKILVFSFFLDTIDKINRMLGEKCIGTIRGSVSPDKRQEIIDDFDKAPSGSVLTAQIQSGGTGLNIQSASVIILCEPQLKPSIENQAISRAYRMGQVRKVLVYRLLCENTIDEKIMGLLAEKQAIFDAFADKSVAAEKSLEIDDKTFGSLIQEEIDRINKKNGVKTDEPVKAERPAEIEQAEPEPDDAVVIEKQTNDITRLETEDTTSEGFSMYDDVPQELPVDNETKDEAATSIEDIRQQIHEFQDEEPDYQPIHDESLNVKVPHRDITVSFASRYKDSIQDLIKRAGNNTKGPYEFNGRVQADLMEKSKRIRAYMVYASHNNVLWFPVGEIVNKVRAKQLIESKAEMKVIISAGNASEYTVSIRSS